MIGVIQKRNFVKHMLKDYLKTDLSYDFFKELYVENDLLNRVEFSRDILTHYKYSISININKKHMLIRINGKYVNNERFLNYVLRALYENPKVKLNVCVVNSESKFTTLIETVCRDESLVTELLNEVVVDKVLVEVEKQKTLKLIDKALDENNKEEFELLVKKYKDLQN